MGIDVVKESFDRRIKRNTTKAATKGKQEGVL
jgi:hypothetical protein